ncbi:hypothetical protein [Labedaea rhizosphaerae]|uniref:Uncharacterized protein n=1 Tax=Labedaea rhizosphaerae TaxID=598644 RepID=A0A4R6S581_LABRH|nr:hypothetical protein [Labedaea rhizosphaerae]TDP93895.1 hypothetical protein EV186_106289 [Labedaea rhizosphaerae]
MTLVQQRRRGQLKFIVLLVAALAAAGGVWFGMPHEKAIPNIGILLVKLVPFVLAVEAIAAMNLSARVRRGIALAALPVCFLVYFGYFVPKIFFSASGEGTESPYYYVLTLTPFLILAMVLAFRLGGGSGGTSRRLGYAMILLQLSGIEDLAFLTINNHTDPKWTPIPEVWAWADHMTVFLGHPLTKYQAFAFIAIHVVLALLILTLPASLFRRFTRRNGAATAEDSAPVEAAPEAAAPDAVAPASDRNDHTGQPVPSGQGQ